MDTAPDLVIVMQLLRSANDELVAALDKDDPVATSTLLDRISSLERRRNRLVRRRNPAVAPVGSYESSIPVRDQVIRALHLTGRATSGRLVSDVTKARWAERVDSAKLSYLRRDEARSWEKSQSSGAGRDVYVVPALTYDRFAPVRGTVALSTWSLGLRIIAPLSPRVDMLHATIALAAACEPLAGTTYETSMLALVRRLAGSVPGMERFDADPAAVVGAARAELREIQSTDDLERAAAAERARTQLDDSALLFGTHLRTIRSHGAEGSS